MVNRALILSFSLLLWYGCSDDGGALPGDGDSGPGQDVDAGGSGSDDAGGDSQVVRFVVMGDTGTGTQMQYDVAAGVEDICDQHGCDFVLLLGDNLYDKGVNTVDDPLWQELFELPYQNIDLPFYAALGNHDYGGRLAVSIPGLGNEWDRGPVEVEYSDHSDKWTMPATHYTFRVGNVGFIVLDTNAIMWDHTDEGDQTTWYADALAELDGADWIFAAGHHPYLSNGAHGNAGSYESIEVLGAEIPNPVSDLNGTRIKSFFDDQVCGTVRGYFSGHDHNRQWLDEPDALCGAELVVSGAGGKLTDLETDRNDFLFEDDTKPGFLYVIIEGGQLTGRFFDADGAVDFTRTLSL
jgi:hypothetical protein